MNYQTIILELLQDRPELYGQLRRQRALLVTMERYATELKTSHEAWKDQLAQARPDSEPEQIASEALELALQELTDSLPAESPPEDDGPISLDAAMAFLKRPTPPA